jgi:hypothetical protein
MQGRLEGEAAGAAGSGAVSLPLYGRCRVVYQGLIKREQQRQITRVGLSRGNCVMYRKALGLRADLLDQGFQPGSGSLTDEVL